MHTHCSVTETAAAERLNETGKNCFCKFKYPSFNNINSFPCWSSKAPHWLECLLPFHRGIKRSPAPAFEQMTAFAPGTEGTKQLAPLWPPRQGLTLRQQPLDLNAWLTQITPWNPKLLSIDNTAWMCSSHLCMSPRQGQLALAKTYKVLHKAIGVNYIFSHFPAYCNKIVSSCMHCYDNE